MTLMQRWRAFYHHSQFRKLRRRLAPYSFGIFIASSVLLAVGITLINMALYVTSGASSIDISRPSYQAVRESVTTQKEEKVDFDASSKLTTKTIDLFKKLEAEAAASRANVTAHNDKIIDDESLGIPAAGN